MTEIITSLIALAITAGFYGLCWSLGAAFQHHIHAWAGYKVRPASRVLIAPIFGLCLILSLCYFFSIIGIPLSHAAFPILGCCLSYLVWRVFKISHSKRFVLRRTAFGLKMHGLLLLGWIATGWPLILYGYDYISVCNNDMVFYCNESQWFQNRGMFTTPDPASGHSYDQIRAVIPPGRCAWTLLLACTSSISGLSPIALYEPLALVIHVILLAAIGAAAASLRGRARMKAGIAIIMSSFSAIISCGTILQLVPQQMGVAMLITALVLTINSVVRTGSLNEYMKRLTPLLLVVFVLCFTFPELLPFYILSCLIFLTWCRLRRKIPLSRIIGWPVVMVLASAPGTFILIYSNLSVTIQQGMSKQASDTVEIFPYYLMPSGIANFLGWIPHGTTWPNGIGFDILLICGMLVVFTLIALAIKCISANDRAAMIWSPMLLVSAALYVKLFSGDSGFGLFKLAMIVAPFMAIAVANTCAQWPAAMKWTFLLVLLGPSILTQTKHVYGSLGFSFTEIADASTKRIYAKLRALSAVSEGKHIIDTPSLPLAGLIACEFEHSSNGARVLMPQIGLGRHTRQIHPLPKGLSASAATAPTDAMLAWNEIPVIADSHGGIFTGAMTAVKDNSPIWSIPRNELRAVFLPTDIGTTVYNRGGLAQNIAIWQAEPDVFQSEKNFAACYRPMTFRIHGVGSGRRFIILSFSKSTLPGINQQLGMIRLITEKGRSEISVKGRGSLRIHAPFEGEYLEINTGEVGYQYPSFKTGLMCLWGRNLRSDRRILNGVVRELAVVDEMRLSHILSANTPSHVNNFPTGLLNKSVFYSGIYEDGWLAENASIHLRGGGRLTINGEMPALTSFAQGAQMHIAIGESKHTRHLIPGKFTLRFPGIPPGIHCIEIQMSGLGLLPKPDERTVSIRLHSIGFEELADRAP